MFFCKQRLVKIGKKFHNAKQHPEDELLLFEKFTFFIQK